MSKKPVRLSGNEFDVDKSSGHILTYDGEKEEILSDMQHLCLLCKNEGVSIMNSSFFSKQGYLDRADLDKEVVVMENQNVLGLWVYIGSETTQSRKKDMNYILQNGNQLGFYEVWKLGSSESVEILLLSLASKKLNSTRRSEFLFRLNPPDAWKSGSWTIETYGVQTSLVALSERQEFGFVTCGGYFGWGRLSFWGYISAFDSITWLALGIVYVVLGIFLSLVSGHLHSESVAQVRIFYMGIRVLLEQGDDVAVNSKRLGFMYWVCSVWILVAVVISNAYKGNNIMEMIAPMEIAGMRDFKELYENTGNLTIYTKHRWLPKNPSVATCSSKGYKVNPLSDWGMHIISMDIFNGEFHTLVDDWIRPYALTANNSGSGFINLFKHKLFNRVRLYEDCGKFVWGNFTFFDVIKDCQTNTAFVGWGPEIEAIRLKLELELKLRNIVNPVSFGRHPAFHRSLGWKMHGYYLNSFPDNLALLQSSGLMQQWRKVTKFWDDSRNKKDIQRVERVDVSASIEGNVVTVFIILGVGLLIVMVVWGVEVSPGCGRWVLSGVGLVAEFRSFIKARKLREGLFRGGIKVNHGNVG